MAKNMFLSSGRIRVSYNNRREYAVTRDIVTGAKRYWPTPPSMFLSGRSVMRRSFSRASDAVAYRERAEKKVGSNGAN